jgi:hypothetical protein
MLTVHIGLHKTGSSSIQIALRRSALSTVVLPQVGDDQSDESVFDRISNAAGFASVVSDENLLGSCSDGYIRAPERVRLLARALTGTPYKLVVYLRPQLQWIESVYIQHIQSGGTAQPRDFLEALLNSPYVRWKRLLELLRAESGADHVVARAYLPKRDVVGDFFTLAQLNVTGSSPYASRSNISLLAEQVPILRTINEAASLTRPERQVIRGVLQQMASSSTRQTSAFPGDAQELISETFREDWTVLSEDPSCLSDCAEFSKGSTSFDSVRVYSGSSTDDQKVRDELASIMYELCNEKVRHDKTLMSRIKRRLTRVQG